MTITIGNIFSRINWKTWFAEILTSGVASVQQTKMVSQLFNIFIRISFVPEIHNICALSTILEDALNYPWHLIDSQDLEALFQWFTANVDPSIVLKNTVDTNYVDRAVLE